MDNMFESMLESNLRDTVHEEVKDRDTVLVEGTYSKETFDPSNSGKSPFDQESALNPFDEAAASNVTSIKNTIVQSNISSMISKDKSVNSIKMEDVKLRNP
jgi:hypothetical protein